MFVIAFALDAVSVLAWLETASDAVFRVLLDQVAILNTSPPMPIFCQLFFFFEKREKDKYANCMHLEYVADSEAPIWFVFQ